MNRGLRRIARETGLPMVATNDAHYIRREDSAMQDVLMCIQMQKTVDDPGRMKFETQESTLKVKRKWPRCSREMRSLGEHPEDR